MTRRRAGRLVFGVGFTLLLVDGAAAIWLGQISGRAALILVGGLLLVAGVFFAAVWRRWMAALDAVEDLRRDLKQEIARLRDAADEARAHRGDP